MRLRRQLGEKFTQSCRCLELRNGIELLERARERVGQTPHCPRRELLVLWLEVEPVDLGQEASRRFELAIHKRRVEDQLRLGIADLSLAPALDLALHGLEVPLNPVHADRERINQVEALGVLGQDRSEYSWDNVS